MFHATAKFLDKLAGSSQSKSKLPPDQREFLDAARSGDEAKVRALLAKGVPVDVREDFCTQALQNLQTALMYAAWSGHLTTVTALINAGASLSAADKNMSREDEGEQTPLHYAVRQKNLSVIEEILNAGADVNALTTRKNTPLNTALWHGNIEGVRLLIQRGTNLSSKIGRKQVRSPLFAAIDAIRNEVPSEIACENFLLLLNAGADVNGTGDLDQTPVYPLILQEKLSDEAALPLLEKLLQAGAKPEWADKIGNSPLESALQRHKPWAVKLLVEAGADINRVYRDWTLLDLTEQNLAMLERNLKQFSEGPIPADEKRATLIRQSIAMQEQRVGRCREILEILGKLGAKRKADLPSAS